MQAVIFDERNRVIRPCYQAGTKEQHFAFCVQFFVNSLADASWVREIERQASADEPMSNQTISMGAAALLITNLYSHEDLRQMLIKQGFFAKIEPLLQLKIDESDQINQAMITHLRALTTETISRVSIVTNLSEHQEKLTEFAFPSEWIPAHYCCAVSGDVMVTPCHFSEQEAWMDLGFLQRWYQTKQTNPLSGVAIELTKAQKNDALAAEISLFIEKVNFVYTIYQGEKLQTHYANYKDRILNTEYSAAQLYEDLKKDHAKALYRSAVDLFNAGNFSEALECFQCTREGFALQRDEEAMATCYYSISSCYMRLHQYAKANEAIDQCIEIRAKKSNKTDLAFNKAKKKKDEIAQHQQAHELFKQAKAAFAAKSYEKAQTLLLQAQNLHPCKQDKDMAKIVGYLGLCRNRVADFAGAAEYTQQYLLLLQVLPGDNEKMIAKAGQDLVTLEAKLPAEANKNRI